MTSKRIIIYIVFSPVVANNFSFLAARLPFSLPAYLHLYFTWCVEERIPRCNFNGKVFASL